MWGQSRKKRRSRSREREKMKRRTRGRRKMKITSTSLMLIRRTDKNIPLTYEDKVDDKEEEKKKL